MISNFALLLSHEGIKLAHRTADGWAEIGHASLLDDDLSAKLNQMRAQAEALSVSGFSSKIVLPHDQIKYLTLPNFDDDQREEAIKEALERATPYLIDDLVYDWEASDDGMNVAAVARDTLSEAESFIVRHGFNPVSFVAAPDDALFSVEPFFGSCSSVAADEDIRDSIEAEVDKVILTAPTEAPMAEVIDDFNDDENQTEADVPPDDTPTEDGETPTAADSDPAPDGADMPDDADTPDDSDTPEDTGDTDEAKPPRLAPLVADRDEDLSKASFPLVGPATSTSILGGMQPAIRPAPAVGIGAEPDSDVEDRTFPSWAGPAEKNAPFSMDETIEPAKVGWLRKSKTDDADDSNAPPSWMKTDDPASDDLEDSEFEEDREAAAWVAPTAAAPVKQPLYDEVETEAEKLEIFGNRGERDRPGAAWNPLWIGAIVLAVLLLIGGSFFAVRFFAAPSEPQIATPEDSTPLIAADEAPVAAPTEETAPDPAAETPTETAQQASTEPPLVAQESEVTLPEPEPTVDLPPVEATTEFSDPANAPLVDDSAAIGDLAEAPAFEATTAPSDAPAQPAAEVAVEAETTAPDALPEPVADATAEEPIRSATEILAEAPGAGEIAPIRPGTEDAAPASEATVADPAPEPAPEPAVEPAAEDIAAVDPAAAQPSDLSPDLLERAASDWTSLSVEAREARYAATGIWPLAPEAPPSPSGETVGALFLATIDPVVFATDAFAITATADLLSDKAMTSVPNPPAPGTRFERDERGFVLATPEGVVTPDGITVFQGIPPIIPPLAARIDPVDQQAALRAALEGKVPRLRPEQDPAPAETETAAEATTTADAPRVPPLRPASIAALALPEAVVLNPLALDRSPLPRLRPNNIGEIVYNTERAALAAQITRPVAPTNGTVSANATDEQAITLRGIILIGIYGEAGDRRALVRMQSGRYTKIEVGDRLNGGQVTAIDQDRILYTRNGQTVVLRMPGN
jgi:hypothetical protein